MSELKCDNFVPEYMVRIKLPNPDGYASCPSGDTEYERDWKDAILAAKPPGFDVYWPRAGEKWPVDSEGFTFVRLYCNNEKDALAYWMDKARRIERKLNEVRKALA